MQFSLFQNMVAVDPKGEFKEYERMTATALCGLRPLPIRGLAQPYGCERSTS